LKKEIDKLAKKGGKGRTAEFNAKKQEYFQLEKLISESYHSEIIDEVLNRKADELIEQNKDKEFAVNAGNYEALILAEPKMEDDFRGKLEEAGHKYRNNRFMCINNIGYSRGSSESSSAFKKDDPVMYYFHNHVVTLEDIMSLVDSVVKQEGEKGFRRMKLYCDFGIMIKESKVSIQDPYRYHYQTPLDRNTHRSIPIIIKDDETKEKYKQIVKDTIIHFQEKALSSTKHKIVAIYSMMIVSFRLPIVGRKQEP
jgi:hypothetical protein